MQACAHASNAATCRRGHAGSRGQNRSMRLVPKLALAVTFATAPAPSEASDGFCEFENIFGAGPPPYYVAYKNSAGSKIKIDGSLDDPAWLEVPFTRSNPDICGTAESCPTEGARSSKYPCGGNCCLESLKPGICDKPRFTTRQKIRWDDEFLYVGAELEEPQVWANNTQHDSVVFQDNDYEVFISPDGSNHYYKEYEMNARGTWWDLCLNKPYNNGGYENSSRVFKQTGWDDPGLRTAAKVFGCTINDPSSGPCKGWSVEIAFPLAGARDTILLGLVRSLAGSCRVANSSTPTAAATG